MAYINGKKIIGFQSNVSDAIIKTYDTNKKSGVQNTDDGTISHHIAADGNNSLAVNRKTQASGPNSFAANYQTEAKGDGAFTSGINTKAHNKGCFSEGINTVAGDNTVEIGTPIGAHAEGVATKANGYADHAEGNGTATNVKTIYGIPNTEEQQDGGTGGGSVGETETTDTTKTLADIAGIAGHAQGNKNQAIGNGASAGGQFCIAVGDSCNAHGYKSVAGLKTVNGDEVNEVPITDISSDDEVECAFAATADGAGCVANGDCSHAGGAGTIVRSDFSYSHGKNNVVQCEGGAAFGENLMLIGGMPHKFVVGYGNKEDGGYLFAVGNGYHNSDDELVRQNAFTVYGGGIRIGSTFLSEDDLKSLLALIHHN